MPPGSSGFSMNVHSPLNRWAINEFPHPDHSKDLPGIAIRQIYAIVKVLRASPTVSLSTLEMSRLS